MTTTGQVLPSVAHELNNSLQIIAGMVEILGLRGQLPPETADKVQKIGVQATKAARACCAIWSPSPGATASLARSICMPRSNAPRAATLLPVARPRHGARRRARQEGRWSRRPTASSGAGAREPDFQRRGSRSPSRTHARSASISGATTASCTARSAIQARASSADVAARARRRSSRPRPSGAAGLGLAVAQRLVEQDGGRSTSKVRAGARARGVAGPRLGSIPALERLPRRC